METFGLSTSSCRMDLLILSISRMDTNINAQGARHALSLLKHVDSCRWNLESTRCRLDSSSSSVHDKVRSLHLYHPEKEDLM